MPERRILVFAKAPVPGQVKTRLIPALGPEGAARLYRQMVEHALGSAAAAGPGPVELWCVPDDTDPFLRECAGRHGAVLRVQRGRDVGERMADALATALKSGARAVLVGSDCPALDARRLVEAFTALEEVEAVFNPAEDGGYMLVGLRRPLPEVFRDIPWSGPEVMERTRERLRALGVGWRELPPLWDVDRPEDLERLRRLGWELPARSG